MDSSSIFLPSYSIGESVCDKIGEICSPYGSTAVVIGGHRAMDAIGDQLRRGAEGAIELVEFRWYGGECCEENIAALAAAETVQSADMIFAVGGGKALDTCKVLGERLNKPVFTFPTIASTCAACTAVSIVYHPDGSFAGPHFLQKPAAHAFLCTSVIAAAPPRYLWAGLGDTYAKYFEATTSARGDQLRYYHALGVGFSRMCLDPLLQYGEQAMRDHRQGLATPAVEQVILTIIVTTAIVSILVTTEHIIDYNTGLAHAVFYALTAFPDLPIEKNHLHGEVVGFGVLILLLVDGQEEMFQTMLHFNRAVGLPTKLADIEVAKEDLARVIPQVLTMHDIDHNPYPITADMLQTAFDRLEAIE
jgi:glycerol dehydrogenase